MKFSSNRVTVADTFSKNFKFRDTRKNDKNGPKIDVEILKAIHARGGLLPASIHVFEAGWRE